MESFSLVQMYESLTFHIHFIIFHGQKTSSDTKSSGNITVKPILSKNGHDSQTCHCVQSDLMEHMLNMVTCL